MAASTASAEPLPPPHSSVFSVDAAVRATLLAQGTAGSAAGSSTLTIPQHEGRASRHNILVSANSAEGLAACLTELRACFNSEIASRRRDFTHFVSIPVPGAAPVYAALRDSVMMDPAAAGAAGLDPTVWVSPASLHLTVVMLKLYSGEARLLACEVLQRLQEELQALRGDRPLRVRVRGLELMKGDPAAAHVLYASIGDPNPDPDPGPDPQPQPSVSRLLAMCHAVIGSFAEAGLVATHDVREVRLHLTLINTRYRKPRKGTSAPQGQSQAQQGPQQSTSPASAASASTTEAAAGRPVDSRQGSAAADDLRSRHPQQRSGQARQPFDARSLLAQHGHVDFGEHELGEMHLSQRQLLPGKYYTMLDAIDI